VRLRFGRYTIDRNARQLIRDGRELRLSPKAFDLLVFLLERRPAVVDKATLRDRLWPATHVVEASLSNLVAEIRALGEGDPPPVRTVHGVGYAFAGDVEDLERAGATSSGEVPPCWLIWRNRPIGLSRGENLLGRDASCTVWLDESGVSRRHARIHVPQADADGEVTVEDLKSTNGTFLQGRPVSGTVCLRDGDRLQLGPEVLVFRTRGGIDAPTKKVRRAGPARG
jgi:DNA-binding winged helix-turn-helix (wHTH) protein